MLAAYDSIRLCAQEHLFLVCELLRANLYEFQKYNREQGDEPYFTLPRLQKIAHSVGFTTARHVFVGCEACCLLSTCLWSFRSSSLTTHLSCMSLTFGVVPSQVIRVLSSRCPCTMRQLVPSTVAAVLVPVQKQKLFVMRDRVFVLATGLTWS